MERDFVPALGLHGLTGAYDRVVALTTRERRWRSELLRIVAPTSDDRVLDVGCGTGTFALMLAAAQPTARVFAIDPDEAVLAIARRKPSGERVAWRQAYGDALVAAVGASSMTKVVSSLVLHQCPLETKRTILRAMFEVLVPSGELFIADYGQQRTFLMRTLFKPVQLLDGVALTQPNADGRLPELITEAGFVGAAEAWSLPTPSGSISIYRAHR